MKHEGDTMDIATQQVVDQWNRRIDQLESITNNLANASSLGYKSFRMHIIKLTPQPSATPEVQNEEYLPTFHTDFSRGAIQATGNPLDVAIEGDGFFAIQTANGAAYTRRGNFNLNKNGDLVTDTGENVLNKNGSKINVTGGKVEIGGEGDILVDGRKVDTLKVVTFTDKTKLVRLPGCMFHDPGAAGPADEKKMEIHAEHVETSNVNVVSEMMQMINVQRMIEFYQKSMQAVSELDKLSNSRIGKLYS
jgi:flagellar basal-body rod protein FlgF